MSKGIIPLAVVYHNFLYSHVIQFPVLTMLGFALTQFCGWVTSLLGSNLGMKMEPRMSFQHVNKSAPEFIHYL
jgi:hypothetical protein